jgi:hypothetical protein
MNFSRDGIDHRFPALHATSRQIPTPIDRAAHEQDVPLGVADHRSHTQRYQ